MKSLSFVLHVHIDECISCLILSKVKKGNDVVHSN